jgi:hypothetical protein
MATSIAGTDQAVRAGTMTAVMRSVARQTGPKVLRIAEVRGGRVVDERVLPRRTSFTVDGLSIFEARGSHYYLGVVDGMTGRVALATEISDLSALAAGATPNARGAFEVLLTEDARGKVVVGETTYLFQFVAPPVPEPRPQLPLGVRAGIASRIDWNLTIIAAFSFVLHFGFVGGMYSDWLDPVVSAPLDVRALVDLDRRLPDAPVERATTYADSTPTAAPTAAPAAASPKPASTGTTAARRRADGTSATSSPDDARALSSDAETMRVQILTGWGGGTALDRALERSELPSADLSQIAASSGGVRTASDLELARAGGVVHPGARRDLASIAVTHGGDRGPAGPAGTDRGGPSFEVELGAPIASAHVSGAERVVAGLKPKFRACYNKGLAADPTMAGSVTIVAKIGPNGEVTGADPSGGGGLSLEVQSCLARVVRNAPFEAAAGAGATLQIPVKFVQQR